MSVSEGEQQAERWRSRIVGQGELPPSEFLANPANWRIHGREQRAALADVLDQVGWVQQVIVNQRTGHLVDGHARVDVAVERGEEMVPVVYVDLSEEEERLILTTLDPLAALAGTDSEQLAELLKSIGDAEGDGLGRMLKDMAHDLPPVGPALDPTKDPNDAPEPPAQPITQPGDIWELGEHRLICGDARDAAVLERLMENERAEMLWTDPPYGVGIVGGNHSLSLEERRAAGGKEIANDDLPADELQAFLVHAFEAASDYMNPSARFYIAAPAGPRGTDFRLAIQRANWTFHEALVWVKDSLVLGYSDYHYRHEDVLYGWKPGTGRPGRGNHEGTRWWGDHSQTTVFEIDRPKRSEEHPTMKPVELIEAHLRNSSRRDDVVLDIFAGSGSTMIACENFVRRARCVELDPAYCDVIVARFERLTGKSGKRLAAA